MIVEDEKMIRKGIKVLLEEVLTGFQVIWEAENGKKANQIINIEVPDIIFTDIRMPEMDGLEFIGILKNKLPDVPVIIISGYDDFTYVRKAFKYGVRDYLLKPIKQSELVSVLKGLDNQTGSSLTMEDPVVIRNIKGLIENHLEDDLSLRFISNALNLHPNYISQCFKDYVKTNLSNYILTKRMERAEELLIQTNLKVYDIANLVGYQNAKHFSSVFKKYSGKTPQKYRNEVI